jgi:hypothetical protein
MRKVLAVVSIMVFKICNRQFFYLRSQQQHHTVVSTIHSTFRFIYKRTNTFSEGPMLLIAVLNSLSLLSWVYAKSLGSCQHHDLLDMSIGQLYSLRIHVQAIFITEHFGLKNTHVSRSAKHAQQFITYNQLKQQVNLVVI